MPLPANPDPTRSQVVVWTVSIAAAWVLFVAASIRIATHVDLLEWWTPIVLLAGLLAADFASGVVHWAADTWGRDDLPVVGPRLLTPFRLHHVNPDDFLRRSFVDTNGDVALIAAAGYGALLVAPLDTTWGAAAAVSGLGFCGLGMMTNQIHQWAHMPSPPAAICLLQRLGLILGRAAHAVHHVRPYDAQYCITTGWCNRPLAAVELFRRLEAAVTALTGLRPRDDDARYERRYGATR